MRVVVSVDYAYVVLMFRSLDRIVNIVKLKNFYMQVQYYFDFVIKKRGEQRITPLP